MSQPLDTVVEEDATPLSNNSNAITDTIGDPYVACIGLFSESAKWATNAETKHKFRDLMQNVHREMMEVASVAAGVSGHTNHNGMLSQLATDCRSNTTQKKKVTLPSKKSRKI
jgi:hypothetical protein